MPNELGDKSGYPSWQDFVPTLKAQTIIMAQLSNLAYEHVHVINQAVTDDNNKITTLGTIFYFTAAGALINTDPVNRFTVHVPANQDPFILTESDSISFPAGSVHGFNIPMGANPSPYDADNEGNIVVAFHCYLNSKNNSNQIAENLQYFSFNALEVVSDTQTGIIGNLVNISQIETNHTSALFGTNVFYNNPVIVVRGSKNIQDYLTEFTPPDTLISSFNLAIPPNILADNQIFYSNEASKLIKGLDVYRTLTYLLSPFADGEYQDTRNSSLRIAPICLTGHSYGAAVCNIVARYLVEVFIPKTAAQFQPTVYVETYSFESPPFQKSTAKVLTLPLLDRSGKPLLYTNGTPAKINDFLIIRNFINNNDAVPSLNVPNLSDAATEYVFPTTPTNIYKFYRINATSHALERILTYKKEPAISLPLLGNQSGSGVPAYLAFNPDHEMSSVITNLTNISVTNFDGFILGTTHGINYGDGTTPPYIITRWNALNYIISDIPKTVNLILSYTIGPNAGAAGYIPGTNIKFIAPTFNTVINFFNSLR